MKEVFKTIVVVILVIATVVGLILLTGTKVGWERPCGDVCVETCEDYGILNERLNIKFVLFERCKYF